MSRIAGRLKALAAAIEQRDWDLVTFHFNNVVRGVANLVASTEISRLPDEEVWTPLERTQPVPLSQEAKATLRARGAGDDLLDELAAGQLWRNPIYTVMVTHHADGWVEELSIRRNDRQPVHDWRHFQMIKTQLAGADVEAFELYPAEDRLMDTANQYYVFCMPPGHTLPVGYSGPRLLIDAEEQEKAVGSVQRVLPEGWTSTFADIYADKDVSS